MKNDFAGMTNEEILEYLNEFEESDEKYFSDNSAPLLKLAGEGDPEIRGKSIDLLWDEASPEVFAALLRWSEADPDELVRCRAIIGLGRYVNEGDLLRLEEDDEELISREEFRKLLSYLKSLHKEETRSFDERRYALEALSFCEEEDIQEMIQAAYDSGTQDMKISAIFSMGRNGLSRWAPVILKELESEDEELLIEAIKAAAAMSLEEAGDKLLKLSESDNVDIVINAIYALGYSGWEGAYERLNSLCDSDDEDISGIAEAALNEWVALNEIYEDEDELE